MAGVNVKLETLGRFSLRVNGEVVKPFANGLSRPWQMFVLLALQENRCLSDTQLMEHLWENSNSDQKDAKNSLKNLALRLKKELRATADFASEPLCRHNAGYRLSEEFEIEADVLAFRALCEELYNGREKSAEELPGLCHKILELYRGDFACPGNTAKWMKDLAMETAAQFLEIMGECCNVLWNHEMYRDILGLHQRVSRVRKPSDEMTAYRFRAMSVLGMHRGITSAYHKTAADFGERGEAAEEGPVIAEIREIAKNAHLFLAKKEKAVAGITRQLSRELLEAGAGDRAMMVSFSALKKMCREHPGRYAMAVFTFRLPRAADQVADMEEAVRCFQAVAEHTLRGHDMVAPYADNQLVVLMPNHSISSGHQVKERLCSSFRKQMGEKTVFLETDVSELRPAAAGG